MKKILGLCLAVIYTFSAQTFAQSPEIDGKINLALYSSYSFRSSEHGIKRLIRAWHDATTIEPYRSKMSTQEWKSISEARQKELVQPIETEIARNLESIEKKDSLIILDGGELAANSVLLAFDGNINITDELITFFNAEPAPPIEDLKIIVPRTKIGVIDSTLLFDKNDGIKSLGDASDLNSLCENESKCDQLHQDFQTFADKNGYGIIIDSSKELSEKLKTLKFDDLTSKFILEQNIKK